MEIHTNCAINDSHLGGLRIIFPLSPGMRPTCHPEDAVRARHASPTAAQRAPCTEKGEISLQNATLNWHIPSDTAYVLQDVTQAEGLQCKSPHAFSHPRQETAANKRSPPVMCCQSRRLRV